ncbi:adult-specific cuticular protein ACP-20-like [Culicoides brevitarsis]|uniref:adult-specific cuticular protein ACP-20-like n=1 Tax=Culicoides brevitarsis TaxID=469753 RepID=UPI00307B7209
MAFQYIAVLALISSAAAAAIPAYHDNHYSSHGSSSLGSHSSHGLSSHGLSSHGLSSHGLSHGSGLAHKLSIARPTHYDYHHDEEHYAPAHYEFAYEVHDDHTGDIKSQKETRDGDKVQGFYTLVEPDGHRRTVHYTADKHSGFVAEVKREFVGHQHGHDNYNNYNNNNKYHGNHHHDTQIHSAHPRILVAASPKVQYTASHDHSATGNSHGLSHGHYNNYHH